jgi:hypothetical protein
LLSSEPDFDDEEDFLVLSEPDFDDEVDFWLFSEPDDEEDPEPESTLLLDLSDFFT